MNQVAKKILFIKNDDLVSAGLELKLKEFSQVEIATDVAAVNKFLNENQYNLIIIDITLQKADGLKLLESIKKTCQMPVLAVCDSCPKEYIEKAVKLGIIDYFMKSDSSISSIAQFAKNFLGIQ